MVSSPAVCIVQCAVGGRAVTRHEAIGNFESILDVNIRGGMTEVS